MTDVVATPSEAQLVEVLSTVIGADGSVRIAKRRLKERGVDMAEGELRQLVAANQTTYLALAEELSRAQEEAIAQSLRETIGLSQKVTKAFLEEIADAIDENGIAGLDSELRRQLPQTVQALTKVTQVGVDKLLTITGRPQDGSAGNPLEGAQTLIDMGLLVPRARADVDGTAADA